MKKNKMNINMEYYSWLCTLIDVEQIGRSYWNLTQDLYDKPFKWSVPNDDNRAFEGKNLREQFCEDVGLLYSHEFDEFNEEVSMLELIIALAYRCESIMVDQATGDFKMIDWFWKMIENCGLDKYTDYEYDQSAVDCTLNRIIERTYQRNGKGGLFPLKQNRKDQRRVELWYQMSSYLVENYYN